MVRIMGGKGKMKKGISGFLVLLAVVVVLGGWLASTYNGLVKENELVDGQWAQVESKLQRRHDLIPNLVNTVKGYAQHEEGVFTAIADARARLNQASTVEERVEASNEIESALARLLVIVENYPELKADAQFTRLTDEISGSENRIDVERSRFNDQVKAYNMKVKQFPTVIIARIMGFGPRAYFEMNPAAAEAPKVEF
jgi:LemA protein